MDKIKELVIVNLTKLMRERGLSQVELANNANMDPVQLNRILKGKNRAGPKSLNSLALALGVPVDHLIQSEPPKAKPTQTVSSLLQALSSMERELIEVTDKLNKFKANRLAVFAEKVGPQTSEKLLPIVEDAYQSQPIGASHGNADNPSHRKGR